MPKNRSHATSSTSSLEGARSKQDPRGARARWIERSLFALGSVLVFAAEFGLQSRVEVALDDAAYLKRNIDQVQYFEQAKEHWTAEYNRSATANPLNKNLIAINAFQLYVALDQILTIQDAVLNHDGQGEVLSVIGAKKVRHADADRELSLGNVDALVRRVNEVSERFDKTMPTQTTEIALKWMEANSVADRWRFRSKAIRLIGAGMLAAAFLFREIVGQRGQLMLA